MTTGQPAPPIPGNRPSQRVLVIIPTFNERENLPLIHGRLKTACPDVHVLVVDDNSPDGTGQLADELAAADPGHTHVLHRTVKNGLGAAYLEGFAWGLSRQYSVLVEMDADGSHAPEQLHRLQAAVDAGPTWPSVRATSTAARCGTGPAALALTLTANTYARLSLGVSVRHICRLLRLPPRARGDRSDGDSGGYCFQIDLTNRTVQRVRRRRGAHHVHQRELVSKYGSTSAKRSQGHWMGTPRGAARTGSAHTTTWRKSAPVSPAA
jgi:glycosyltransferase involved in cell wall biosynthesis